MIVQCLCSVSKDVTTAQVAHLGRIVIYGVECGKDTLSGRRADVSWGGETVGNSYREVVAHELIETMLLHSNFENSSDPVNALMHWYWSSMYGG